MKDIDRIEVIRGPGGTIWGPNAVNGVINVITKPTTDTQGALVTAGAGAVEQFLGDMRYGSGNGQRFTYRVYATGFGWSPQHHETATSTTTGMAARAASVWIGRRAARHLSTAG